jgi:iron complex outermembrane receptor protein
MIRQSVAAILSAAALAAAVVPVTAYADSPPAIRKAIPAQSLGSALTALARENDVQVVYESTLVSGLQAPSVPDGTPLDAALKALLANSGLGYEFINERTVRVFETAAGTKRTSAVTPAAAESTGVPPAAAPTMGDVGEILVTARKREETLLETPVSIQAFTGQEIQSANLRNLEDVAAFTAGMNFQKLGNSQSGRYNSAIRFRGLELLITTPTSQTGSLFVDGVYVLGGAASLQFTDVERIEVIRGPQAAYFGRGTFGGAINYVTSDPADSFRGRVGAEYSPNFGSSAFNASIEGPLAETLTGRLSVSSRKRGAMFTATDGGALGEERTDMATAAFAWRPTDSLKVKFRAVYGEDNDGAASSAFVPFSTYGNCPAGTPITVLTTTGDVATTMRRNLHCGEVPLVKVTSNTTFYTLPNTSRGPVDTRFYLVGNGGLPATDTPALDHFGLKSIFHLYTLSGDYSFTDSLSLSTLFGYNKRATTQIRDDDNYDTYGRVTKGFLALESKSAEARLNYTGGRLRAMFGVNWFEQKTRGDIDGGIGVVSNLLGAPSLGAEGGAIDSGDIETTAAFGSVEYDVTTWLTLSAEGRYQKDKRDNFGGAYPGPYTHSKAEDNNTLPRFLATFKPVDGTTIYTSYAEGALPGTRNTIFTTLSPAEQAAIVAAVPGLVPELEQQKLKSYEIGWKQSLAPRSWLSMSAYKMKWANIPGSAQVTFISPTNGRVISTGVSLPGDAELKGLEAELAWSPLAQLVLRASAGYVNAKYTNFISAGLNSYFGLTGRSYKADGHTLPRSPKQTFALSGTWTDTLTNAWDWYVRADASYAGKAYTDETNLSWVGAYKVVNGRFGLTRNDGFNIELFCTNCLNENGWRTGRRAVDWIDTSPVPNNLTRVGAIVQPIEKREFGIRMQYDF